MASAHIGTSGFAYDEWRGDFYPPAWPRDRLLEHYASRLSAVEIDSTFYRMPSHHVLEAWASMTPGGFRFALKVPRRITHAERLGLPSSSLDHFLSLLPTLGARLGPLLLQLPPFLPREDARLARFLDALARTPGAPPIAVELRNPSWMVEDVYAILQTYGAALCIDERDDGGAPVRLTADVAYVRLRRAAYAPDALDRWARRLRGWVDRGVEVYAFVKHEGKPDAPRVAEELATRIAAARTSRTSIPSHAPSAP